MEAWLGRGEAAYEKFVMRLESMQEGVWKWPEGNIPAICMFIRGTGEREVWLETCGGVRVTEETKVDAHRKVLVDLL